MATTNILRVPGSYIIVSGTGTNNGVVIDVSTSTSNVRYANSGTVTIYGNLDVIGNSTYIESTNSTITDNILFLNSGETNNYVSQGTSGIAISRGSVSTLTNAATFLYDDTQYWNYDNITTHRGIWELKTNNASSAIRVNAIRTNAASSFLNFLGKENPYATLNVKGTIDYENGVLDDDDIPNKKYVDDHAVASIVTAKKLQVGGTFVELKDNSVYPSDPYYNTVNRITLGLGTATNIVLRLEDTRTELVGMVINDTSISVNGGRSSESLRLFPVNTGTIEINSALSLANTIQPASDSRFTRVYSTSTVGGGGTGLYYVNTKSQDELVSRKRSIIYGIIF